MTVFAYVLKISGFLTTCYLLAVGCFSGWMRFDRNVRFPISCEIMAAINAVSVPGMFRNRIMHRSHGTGSDFHLFDNVALWLPLSRVGLELISSQCGPLMHEWLAVDPDRIFTFLA